MNASLDTLPKVITARFFLQAQDYAALQRHWSRLVNARPRPELNPAHYLLYQIVRGKDWRKAFTPITNQRKLANGGFYNWRLRYAIYILHNLQSSAYVLAPFDGLITPATLEMARQLVPIQLMWPRPLPDFATTRYPANAYQLPADWQAETESEAQIHA